jgi:hypothetical protein
VEFLLSADKNSEMSPGEEQVWEALKRALLHVEGKCFHRYPIFGKTGLTTEVDFLIAQREWGIILINVGDQVINAIEAYDDYRWAVRSKMGMKFHLKNPYEQVVGQLYAFWDQFSRDISFSDILRGQVFLGLPNISYAEWQESNLAHAVPAEKVIFLDNLEPDNLRQKLVGPSKPVEGRLLSKAKWKAVLRWLEEHQRLAPKWSEQAPIKDEEPFESEKYERDSPSIFISYRRQDSAWAVRYLHDILCDTFKEHLEIFLDVDNIGYGERFDRVLEEEVKKSNLLIVVIGTRWLTLAHANGMRRLDDPDDYVVREISVALDNNKKLIPILLDGIEMPRRVDLPSPIADLSLLHAFKMDAENFRKQVVSLIEYLREFLRLPEAGN